MSTERDVIDITDDSQPFKSSRSLLCTYPPDGSGGIPIFSEDLECLKDEKWLTDQIIGELSMSSIF